MFATIYSPKINYKHIAWRRRRIRAKTPARSYPSLRWKIGETRFMLRSGGQESSAHSIKLKNSWYVSQAEEQMKDLQLP